MVTTKTQLEVLEAASTKLNRCKIARDDAAANVKSAEDDLKHAEAVLAGCESRLETAKNEYDRVLSE